MPLPRSLRTTLASCQRAHRRVQRLLQDPALAHGAGPLLHLWASVALVAGLALALQLHQRSALPTPAAPSNVLRPVASPSVPHPDRPEPSSPSAGPSRPSPLPSQGLVTGFDDRSDRLEGLRAGIPPAGVWGAPMPSDDAYQDDQRRAERATLQWMDRSGLLEVNLLVAPTGVRHDATWCQAVWAQGAGWGRADGYGATPNEACRAMLAQAVRHYPALARRAVLHGVTLP